MTTQRRRGSADFLVSDELFFTYQLAEQTHRTVDELLTGERRPISLSEFFMWSTYYAVKAHYADHGKSSE